MAKYMGKGVIFIMQIQAILDTTKGSFAMEGMYATKEDEKNIVDVLMGNRALEEVIAGIKQKYIKNEA